MELESGMILSDSSSKPTLITTFLCTCLPSMAIYSPNTRIIAENHCVYYSGKYWFQEWSECIQEGFQQSKGCLCFFWITYADRAVINLLDYVDDMLYFSTTESCLKDLQDNLNAHFDVGFLGQAHWYLSI